MNYTEDNKKWKATMHGRQEVEWRWKDWGKGKEKQGAIQHSLEQTQLKPYKLLIPVQALSAAAFSSSALADLPLCVNIMVVRGKLEGSLHF